MDLLRNVRWIELPSNADDRGVLTSIESGIDMPFTINRIFYMHHIVSNRGGHAHRDTDQVVIAISGCFKMELFDGESKKTFVLDDPTRGIYIPRMVFINMHDFSTKNDIFSGNASRGANMQKKKIKINGK